MTGFFCQFPKMCTENRLFQLRGKSLLRSLEWLGCQRTAKHRVVLCWKGKRPASEPDRLRIRQGKRWWKIQVNLITSCLLCKCSSKYKHNFETGPTGWFSLHSIMQQSLSMHQEFMLACYRTWYNLNGHLLYTAFVHSALQANKRVCLSSVRGWWPSTDAASKWQNIMQ